MATSEKKIKHSFCVDSGGPCGQKQQDKGVGVLKTSINQRVYLF